MIEYEVKLFLSRTDFRTFRPLSHGIKGQNFGLRFYLVEEHSYVFLHGWRVMFFIIRGLRTQLNGVAWEWVISNPESTSIFRDTSEAY